MENAAQHRFHLTVFPTLRSGIPLRGTRSYGMLRDRRGPRRPFGRKSVFELSCSNRRQVYPSGVLREAKPLGRLKTEEAQSQVYCKSIQEPNDDFMLASAVMLVRHMSNSEQFGEGPYSEMSRLPLMALASLIPQIYCSLHKYLNGICQNQTVNIDLDSNIYAVLCRKPSRA